MVLVVISTEGDQGWGHPKEDDLQAKVDCYLGRRGGFLGELSQIFPDCYELYG